MKMDLDELLKKIEKMKKGHKLDLSSEEDLSIAVMNLISIEEHLYFTAMKTGKQAYLDLLNTTREMRKGLLKQLVKSPQGEEWCISKHLLAASMRLIEVGTKYLTKGERKQAQALFQHAFALYSMFWTINLKTDDFKTKLKTDIEAIPESGFFKKFREVVKKIIDCCKE